MKNIVFIVCAVLAIVFCENGRAAAVNEIKDGLAIMYVGDNENEIGDSVFFLNSNLEKVAEGEIETLYASGRVEVLIRTGEVKIGMIAEFPKERERIAQRANGLSVDDISVKDLSIEDRRIYQRGEISPQQYISGGIVGPFVGFGSGHAIQGRFSDQGLKFLIADSLAFAGFMVAGIAACGIQGNDPNTGRCRTVEDIGFGILIAVRIWETYDLWSGPPRENRRYRDLQKMKTSSKTTWTPIAALIPGGGAIAGIGGSF